MTSVFGFWILAFGVWMSVSGMTLSFGCWPLAFGVWISVSGRFWVFGFGFLVFGFWISVSIICKNMISLSPPRRLLAPEVVQPSAMDCGPATLKCLLEGFGVPISYGRLREAC